MENILLTAQGIQKRFGHVQALQNAQLTVDRGEVHSLVGDNGAGKSTLIKVLSGELKPDKGTIVMEGTDITGLSVKESIKAGISTVYQDLALADSRGVGANLFLGRELTRFGFLRKKEMKTRADQLLKQLDIHIPDVDGEAGDLSGGQRQGIAVARVIEQGGKLLIFDEPTAAMGVRESAAVEKLISKLADEGYGILLISHNLPQVFKISHKISVLRRGITVDTLETSHTNMDQVVSLITGNVS